MCPILETFGLFSFLTFLKPSVTNLRKQLRVNWALGWVRPPPGEAHKVDHFKGSLHLDENWFSIRQARPTALPAKTYPFVKRRISPTLLEWHSSEQILGRATTFNGTASPARSVFDTFTKQRAAVGQKQELGCRNDADRVCGVNREICKRNLVDKVITDVKVKWP